MSERVGQSGTSRRDDPVGLVGVGLLGTAILERLLASGLDVHAFDVDPGRAAAAEDRGATIADSIPDVFTGTKRVVLCLPNSDVVDSVVDQAAGGAGAGTIVVDTTTGDPLRTESLAERVASRGVRWVDAAVLGSSAVTRHGDAVLLVGGGEDDVERVHDVLEAIAGTRHHLGPVGSGQRAKLVANLVLGLNRLALAEGLHLAERIGLDVGAVLDVLKSGASYSRVMDAKGDKLLRRDFQPDARLSQHRKDVELILVEATRHDAELPVSAVHLDLLRLAERLGWGDADNCAVIHAFEDGDGRTPSSP